MSRALPRHAIRGDGIGEGVRLGQARGRPGLYRREGHGLRARDHRQRPRLLDWGAPVTEVQSLTERVGLAERML